MPELKERITAQEAVIVRGVAARDPAVVRKLEDDYATRIWAPPGDDRIRYTESSGRASCRLCGAKLPKDETVIVFGFDAMRGYGRIAAAYLHVECPDDGEERDG